MKYFHQRINRIFFNYIFSSKCEKMRLDCCAIYSTKFFSKLNSLLPKKDMAYIKFTQKESSKSCTKLTRITDWICQRKKGMDYPINWNFCIIIVITKRIQFGCHSKSLDLNFILQLNWKTLDMLMESDNLTKNKYKRLAKNKYKRLAMTQNHIYSPEL